MWPSDPPEEWQRQSRRYHTNGLSAVYAIHHVPTNRYYVGSAVNVYGRWNDHRSALNRGIHTNQYLQKAWDKYDPGEFMWFVLECVSDPRLLIEREQVWIDGLGAARRDRGFNMDPNAGSALGRKASEETRRRMSLASRGNLSNLGRKLTEEHRRNISIGLQGKVKISDRQKEVVADALSREWEFVDPEGNIVRVKNLRRFCKENGLSESTMHRIGTKKVCRSRSGWRHPDYVSDAPRVSSQEGI